MQQELQNKCFFPLFVNAEIYVKSTYLQLLEENSDFY